MATGKNKKGFDVRCPNDQIRVLMSQSLLMLSNVLVVMLPQHRGMRSGRYDVIKCIYCTKTSRTLWFERKKNTIDVRAEKANADMQSSSSKQFNICKSISGTI